MRAIAAAALVLLAGACAHPKPVAPVEDLSPLLIADGKVLDGCYDCLLQARDIYQQFASGASRAAVLPRLLETEVLIALREKELAMSTASVASLVRARAVAAELPPEAEADRYLRLAALVLPDNIGTPRAERNELRRVNLERLGDVDRDLDWLRTATAWREPARQYLSLATDCSYLTRPRRLASVAPVRGVWTGSLGPYDVKADLPPLVAYRAAICDVVSTRTLERVRTSVPRSAEAAFFLARPQLENSARVGGGKAKVLLDEARERFPDSPSVVYLSGNLAQLVGDCRRALEFYDRTLAIKAVHEDALLGRTICLSYLGRGDEAIAAATHMIDLRTDNWGEAFYWRAWNYHGRQELPPARADIDRAKTLSGQVARNHTLAGIIEYDQHELTPAEADLRKAIGAWRENCLAMWYLGLLKLDQSKVLESGGQFESAMSCYAGDVATDEKGLREMQARTDVDPEFKARQIAGFEAALKEDRHHQYAAAFNAANEYAQGGNVDKARALVEIAANEPSLAEKVGLLKEILKKL